MFANKRIHNFIFDIRLCEIPTGSPPTRALSTVGAYKFRDFRRISACPYVRNDTRYIGPLVTGTVTWII